MAYMCIKCGFVGFGLKTGKFSPGTIYEFCKTSHLPKRGFF
jgi:hypothetical protein